MKLYTTKPIKELNDIEYKELTKNKEIKVSNHAFDHLSDKQRKVFKQEELIDMIAKETPRKVYLQENKRYAIYFRKQDGYRKVIVELIKDKITVITFMNLKEIQKYKP